MNEVKIIKKFNSTTEFLNALQSRSIKIVDGTAVLIEKHYTKPSESLIINIGGKLHKFTNAGMINIVRSSDRNTLKDQMNYKDAVLFLTRKVEFQHNQYINEILFDRFDHTMHIAVKTEGIFVLSNTEEVEDIYEAIVTNKIRTRYAGYIESAYRADYAIAYFDAISNFSKTKIEARTARVSECPKYEEVLDCPVLNQYVARKYEAINVGRYRPENIIASKLYIAGKDEKLKCFDVEFSKRIYLKNNEDIESGTYIVPTLNVNIGYDTCLARVYKEDTIVTVIGDKLDVYKCEHSLISKVLDECPSESFKDELSPITSKYAAHLIIYS